MADRLALALEELAAAIREEVRVELEAQSSGPTRLLSVDEASTLLGIGRSALYDELQHGRIRTVKVGRRRLVPATAIAEFISDRST